MGLMILAWLRMRIWWGRCCTIAWSCYGVHQESGWDICCGVALSAYCGMMSKFDKCLVQASTGQPGIILGFSLQ